jgi:hypothetical protein
MSLSLLTITAMKTLAIIAAVTIAVFSGCKTSYREYHFGKMPTKNAYYQYWEGEHDAVWALEHAKLGANAGYKEMQVIRKLRLAYRGAGNAAAAFAENKSQFPKDTAKLRATADEEMKAATALFKANSENMKLWCDNYYEIEAAVLQADALAARAMASTSPQ